MAAAAATAMIPSPSATSRRLPVASSTPFFHPLKLPTTRVTARLPKANAQFTIQASSSPSAKERAIAGLTAAAVAAALVVPDIAEAAQPGISPSLKNFLLSIVSGGVVLTAIIGVVVGVSSFDPVKRA